MRAHEGLTVKRPRLNLSVIADIGMEILDMVIIFGLLGEPSTIALGGGGRLEGHTQTSERKGSRSGRRERVNKEPLSLGSRSRWALANR